MADVFMRVKIPASHSSFAWAADQANPSVAYPATYKYGDPWRINKAWLDFVYQTNEYMGTLAGFKEGLQVWSGYINSAPNLAYKPGSYVQYPNPDPYPRIEQVITALNPIKVKERLANAVVFEIFNYYALPPDVNKVNPRTHRWLFDEFHSIDRNLNIGLAPKGFQFWIPRVARNGYARLSLDILEPYELPREEPMTLNPFPVVNKGVAIHRLSQCFNGDINKILDFCQAMGFQSIHMKVGNGQVPWTGLEPFIQAARTRGFSVCGWWYYWGYANEGEISGKHIAYLATVGLQAVELDVEIEFDNSLGTSGTLAARKKNLEPKAYAIGQGLRKYNPSFPIALASWRDPSFRATPTKVFLQYCDANMQQIYSIGTGGPTPATAAQRINDSIAVYAKDEHGGWTGPTIPFLAAYHQDGNYVTVPQLAAVNQRVTDLKLPGLAWYFLSHIIEHTDWAAEIKSHNWPVTYTTVPPTPQPTPLTIEQRMDRAEELFRAHGWM